MKKKKTIIPKKPKKEKINAVHYWAQRDISEMADYWETLTHKHRDLLMTAFGRFGGQFESVLDIGCNFGINIIRLRNTFPELKDYNLHGIDVSLVAINEAKDKLPAVDYQVADVNEGLVFPDKSIDIVLTDATLIYITDKMIKKVIGDICRVAKKAIILCEFADKSELGKADGIYWNRDYKKLLEKEGWDVETIKITKDIWDDPNWSGKGMVYIAVPRSQTLKKK